MEFCRIIIQSRPITFTKVLMILKLVSIRNLMWSTVAGSHGAAVVVAMHFTEWDLTMKLLHVAIY